MNSYYVFSDEAGSYQRWPSEKHLRSHPYYIRSNVIMETNDYRQFQVEMKRIRKKYRIPDCEEIKWSDLWRKEKNNPRNQIISRMSTANLMEYYREIMFIADQKESTQYVYTITDLTDFASHGYNMKIETFYRLHLQDIFQRIQMEMQTNDGFATLVMDDLNPETIKLLKAACHGFATEGDYVEYDNLYQGVLIENSLYSPGIQLADYSAGLMNGFLRQAILSPDNYQFATCLFNDFVLPRLRSYHTGKIVGYGVVDIPKKTAFRDVLEYIFDQDC
ncbi:MAG: DUF3800 domain-containing protein [Clostridiales bacterium]|nr:DUF3800 domain-containing protein [Clostridiales bacterium]